MKILPQSPICGIYRITNLINGKCYIGQSRDIEKRWIDHRRKSPRLSNIYLHRAMRKYGIDNFAFEILEGCEIEQLNALERKYILAVNSLKPNGYNLDNGGEAGKKTSQETREKLCLATLGDKNPNFGKPKSEVTKRKLALSHSPSVNQYSMDGKFIQTYSTTIEALETIGLESNYANRHNICACCRGERGATLGFQWRWANNDISDLKPYRQLIWNSISVSQFDKTGNLIASYQSAQEAAEFINRTNANILFACKNNGTSGGFIWRFTQ